MINVFWSYEAVSFAATEASTTSANYGNFHLYGKRCGKPNIDTLQGSKQVCLYYRQIESALWGSSNQVLVAIGHVLQTESSTASFVSIILKNLMYEKIYSPMLAFSAHLNGQRISINSSETYNYLNLIVASYIFWQKKAEYLS